VLLLAFIVTGVTFIYQLSGSRHWLKGDTSWHFYTKCSHCSVRLFF
jgi:hypothetical protein